MAGCKTTGSPAQIDRQRRIQASAQWAEGHFVPPVAREEPQLLKSFGKWMKGAQNTEPAGPLPIVERRSQDFAPPPAQGLRVTWLGHSTSLVELDGRRVLLDPVWSERASPLSWVGPKRFHAPPLPLAELPALDAVLISHDHYDHLDHETVRALGERVPLFVVPLGVGEVLEGWGLPPERIVELDWWEETALGTLRIVATPARHFSGRSPVGAGKDSTLWSGWALIGERQRVYYSGDTAMFPGFEEIGQRLGPFDLSLIETGAYNALWADVHLGPEQAVVAHQMVQGGLYLPVHWGTFNLALHAWTEPVERVLSAAAAAGVEVALPRPGESVELGRPLPQTRWWPTLPWKTAQEEPVVSSGLSAPLQERIRSLGAAASVVVAPAAPAASAPLQVER